MRKLVKIFTYYKAASIVRMMESILTKVSSFRHSPNLVFSLSSQEVLVEGLSLWLTKYSYSSSGEEELFRQLELTAWSLGSWPPAGQERIVNFPRLGS